MLVTEVYISPALIYCCGEYLWIIFEDVSLLINSNSCIFISRVLLYAVHSVCTHCTVKIWRPLNLAQNLFISKATSYPVVHINPHVWFVASHCPLFEGILNVLVGNTVLWFNNPELCVTASWPLWTLKKSSFFSIFFFQIVTAELHIQPKACCCALVWLLVAFANGWQDQQVFLQGILAVGRNAGLLELSWWSHLTPRWALPA